LGLAEDKAEASIACRQVGPVSFPAPLNSRKKCSIRSLSILFKKLRIVRMVDQKRNALVYLTYSDKLIDGSPQNECYSCASGQKYPDSREKNKVNQCQEPENARHTVLSTR
jgi:CreA protein